MEHDQEDEDPMKEVIDWLIYMGWEADDDKIARLREVLKDKEPSQMPRGTNAAWGQRKDR